MAESARSLSGRTTAHKATNGKVSILSKPRETFSIVLVSEIFRLTSNEISYDNINNYHYSINGTGRKRHWLHSENAQMKPSANAPIYASSTIKSSSIFISIIILYQIYWHILNNIFTCILTDVLSMLAVK